MSGGLRGSKRERDTDNAAVRVCTSTALSMHSFTASPGLHPARANHLQHFRTLDTHYYDYNYHENIQLNGSQKFYFGKL